MCGGSGESLIQTPIVLDQMYTPPHRPHRPLPHILSRIHHLGLLIATCRGDLDALLLEVKKKKKNFSILKGKRNSIVNGEVVFLTLFIYITVEYSNPN